MNYLYCGDNLEILRQSIDTESVDLVYIDPPFNSKRDYNLFFDDKEIKAQRVAFEDTWTLKTVQDSLTDLQSIETEKLYKLLITYSDVAPFAFPYLVMMSLRILELYRVLKPTGNFYVHCDPTMSHYLKTVCDIVFSEKNFRNELIWKRRVGMSSAVHRSNRFGSSTDTILYYAKTEDAYFQPQYNKHDPEYQKYIQERFTMVDEKGRYFQPTSLVNPGYRPNLIYEYKGYVPPANGWMITKEKMTQWDKEGRLYFPEDNRKRIRRKSFADELKGMPIQNLWTDIPEINSQASERLGYPTQKPVALLERIISSSSNEGDLVLDAFCGCGTTIHAAENLHRRWIGIDISPISVNLVDRRLRDAYKHELSKYEVRGLPIDKKSAEMLWEKNPFAFQDWWITEFEAFSSTFGTKGADKGIDGIALYDADGKGSTLRAAFQVKGGKNIGSKDIDALLGAMHKHKCDLGIFLSSADVTKPMQETIALSGQVKVSEFRYPKLQSLTLDEFFQGKRPKLPSKNITFRQAKTTGKKKEQLGLL